jgi:signal transduction histidine kinase
MVEDGSLAAMYARYATFGIDDVQRVLRLSEASDRIRRTFRFTVVVIFCLGLSLLQTVRIRRRTRELRLSNEELGRQTRQAAEANRAKSDFLATMSHEIRTPMNGLLGMADLLSESNLDAEQRKYVEVFQRAGSTLLTLINDILDMSKIEAGHLELESIDFDLKEITRDVDDLLSAKARAKGISLACRIEPGTPAALQGDPERLRQILLNLAGNALKFTHQGSVVVSIRKVPTDRGHSFRGNRYRYWNSGG